MYGQGHAPYMIAHKPEAGNTTKNWKYKVRLTGIDEGATARGVKTEFQRFGAIQGVFIVRNDNDVPTGEAFVQFDDVMSVQRAVANSPHFYRGRSVTIQALPPPPNQKVISRLEKRAKEEKHVNICILVSVVLFIITVFIVIYIKSVL